MKYFIFLFFLAIASEITIQSVLVAAAQQSNSFEEQPLTKVNAFHGDSTDGIIILAALRRRGGNFRGKYKKVIELTTVKAVKAPTEKVKKVTTEKAVEASTERVTQFTTNEVIKVTTTEETVKVTKDRTLTMSSKIRRNEVGKDDNQNPLWIARKRVTRPPKSAPTKKIVKVNVVDEEDYSVRRARYLFSQRSGKK